MRIHKRIKQQAVSPVIAVILMVAITVVLSGMLWALLQFNSPEPKAANIAVSKVDRPEHWIITISTCGSNNYYLEDVRFQVISDEKNLDYQLALTDADPDSYKKGLSTVYPLTISSTVLDNTTGTPVSGASDFSEYENCYIAFIDGDSDNMLNHGDVIYLYKDYDNDGIDNIISRFSFRIVIDGKIAYTDLL
jgi:flagellin-like protein